MGDTREQFQIETSAELERVLKSKNLSLLFGLTRHIYVPKAVREPIQKAKIADELTKTRDQEQLTAKAQAELTEAKAKVVFEEKPDHGRDREAGRRGPARGREEGQGDRGHDREAQGRDRRQDRDHRGPDRPSCWARPRPGRSSWPRRPRPSGSSSWSRRWAAPSRTSRYIFAEGLPADLRLGIFYAGPGTLWTDLKGFEQTMLGKLASEREAKGGTTARGTADGAEEGKQDGPSGATATRDR